MNSWQVKRTLTVLWYAIKVFWPVIAIVGGGAIFFLPPIIDSIASTPHPSLVYIIFGMFVAAVILVGVAFVRYMLEESLAIKLINKGTLENRLHVLEALRWETDMAPVYNVLLKSSLPWRMRQAAIESELFACEEHLVARLSLPGFIAGALVGVGLVGTFVGLLGSLNDLGNIFSALLNIGGKNVDPVSMFGDMIRKLQAPIRSMGTAFVASLYGLLGSLVIGFVLNPAKKTAVLVIGHIRDLIKHEVYDTFSSLEVDSEMDNTAAEERWRSLFEELRIERTQLYEQLSSVHHGIAGCTKNMAMLAKIIEETGQDSQLKLQLMANLSNDVLSLKTLSEQWGKAVNVDNQTQASWLKALNGLQGELKLLNNGVLKGWHSPWKILGVFAVLTWIGTIALVVLFIHAAPGGSSETVQSSTPDKQLAAPVEPATDTVMQPLQPGQTTTTDSSGLVSGDLKNQEQILQEETASLEHSAEELGSPAVSVQKKAEGSLLQPPPIGRTMIIVVKRGQTLSTIAKNWRTSIATLMVLNPKIKHPNDLHAGIQIKVPVPNSDAMNASQPVSKSRLPAVKPSTPLKKTPPISQKSNGQTTMVTVKLGQTLSTIAQSLHIPTATLLALNPQITDPNRVQVGMQIKVPIAKDK